MPPTFTGTDPVGVDVPRGAARRRARRRRRRRARARRLMLHDAHGFWIAEAGSPRRAAAARGRARAPTSSWSAAATPACGPPGTCSPPSPTPGVVVLEAGRCGHGPSGRNGGFVSSLDLSLPTLRARLRRRGGAGVGRRRRARPSTRSAPGARPRASTPGTARGGELCVSTAPAQDGVGADAVDGAARARAERRRRRGRAATRRSSAAACSSRAARPSTRRGSRSGCASGCWRAARRIFEGSRATGMRPVPDGRRRAHGDAGACARARRCWPSTRRPARSRRCATASPSPPATSSAPSRCPTCSTRSAGAAARRSPTAARCCTTCARRATTGSCSAGPAGGWRPARARAGGWRSTTRSSRRSAPTSCASSPSSRGGGSRTRGAGRSTSPPRTGRRSSGCAGCRPGPRSATRATASAPAHLFGRTLAALALDRRDPVTRLPFVDPAPRSVPPEPLRIAGAARHPARARAQGGGRGGGRAARPGLGRPRRAAGSARAPHRPLVRVCRLVRGHAAGRLERHGRLIAGGHGQVARRLIRLLAARRPHRARADPQPRSRRGHRGRRRRAGALRPRARRRAPRTSAARTRSCSRPAPAPAPGAERKRTVDLGAAVKCVEAAEALGVARFVIVSSIGAHDPEAGPEAMRPYLRAKAEADARVAASSLDWTIVRPGEPRPTARAPAASTSRPTLGRRGPVPRDDVALVLCGDARRRPDTIRVHLRGLRRRHAGRRRPEESPSTPRRLTGHEENRRTASRRLRRAQQVPGGARRACAPSSSPASIPRATRAGAARPPGAHPRRCARLVLRGRAAPLGAVGDDGALLPERRSRSRQ